PLGLAYCEEPRTPPNPLHVASQRERLKERDHHAAEAERLHRAGKLVEAIAALEQTLAIERKVLGDTHEEVAQSLDQLAAWHEERGDFAAAGRVRREVLALRTKQYGAEDWRVTDARRALADLAQQSELPAERHRQLVEARRLHQ